MKKKRFEMPKTVGLNGQKTQNLSQDIKLNSEECAKIQEFESKIIESKLQIADLYKQNLMISEKLRELIFNLDTLEQSRMASAKDIIKSHGVDIDDPSKGTWNLDIKTMTFTKMS